MSFIEGIKNLSLKNELFLAKEKQRGVGALYIKVKSP